MSYGPPRRNDAAPTGSHPGLLAFVLYYAVLFRAVLLRCAADITSVVQAGSKACQRSRTKDPHLTCGAA